jgi:predicted RNA binding protein YcfA (HicA-like mRNA interferase family)
MSGRLPSVTARQMLAALKKAGFVEKRQTGAHVILWHPTSRRATSVSMHAGDMKRGTVNGILKQAGLSIEEFLKLL